MTNATKIVVSEDDINYIEKVLLGEGKHFDLAERLPIIKDFDTTFDVNACPGSGKTTVLIAKLLILASKLPFNNHQGICILTHTNVAIDEIKRKLGDKGEVLFKYPNYIGTLQSFVDELLTKPFLKQRLNTEVTSIDDDTYNHELLKIYHSQEFINIKNAIGASICSGRRTYIEGAYQDNFLKFINYTRVKFKDSTVTITNNYNNNLENKNYYPELWQVLIEGILKKGILTYTQAISIAEDYISEFPQLRSFFSSRYRYIFIDEMQDTKQSLNRIIDNIFDKDKCVIQRFGDLNQAIYSGFGDNKCGWELTSIVKSINSSMRYGNNIVNYIEPLRKIRQGQLRGNLSVPTHVPYIIVFDDNSIEQIEATFDDILQIEGISQISNATIKMIGWIGQKGREGDLTLPRYFKDYHKSSSNDEYSKKMVEKLKKQSTIASFWNRIEQVIIEILKDAGIEFSNRQFKEFINNKYCNLYKTLKGKSILWYKNITHDPQSTITIMQETIIKFIKDIWNIDISLTAIQLYLNVHNIQEDDTATKIVADSISHKYAIETVHGVKGETHTATLYLETKYTNAKGQVKCDLSKLLDYIVGNKADIAEEDAEVAAIGYVAMSRATHLTCLGIHIDTVSGYFPILTNMGIKIKACSNDVKRCLDIIIEQQEEA